MSVVIPAKNEAENIGWVLDRLPALVDEVVVVDGNSQDDTVAVARARRPDVVIVSDLEPGKGAAIRAGVAAATGDIVVMLDADGSMDPGEIERFVQPLVEGHQLCRGSRFLPGAGTADMSPLRDLGNRALLAVANVLFRTSRTDLCYGYAAFRRDAFHELELTAAGFEIEAQLFLRAERHGLRVVEVPSFEAPRRNGTSQLNTFRDGWRVLRTVLAERVRRRADAGAEHLRALPVATQLVALTMPLPDLVAEVVDVESDAASTRRGGSSRPIRTEDPPIGFERATHRGSGRFERLRRARRSDRGPLRMPSPSRETPR